MFEWINEGANYLIVAGGLAPVGAYVGARIGWREDRADAVFYGVVGVLAAGLWVPLLAIALAAVTLGLPFWGIVQLAKPRPKRPRRPTPYLAGTAPVCPQHGRAAMSDGDTCTVCAYLPTPTRPNPGRTENGKPLPRQCRHPVVTEVRERGDGQVVAHLCLAPDCGKQLPADWSMRDGYRRVVFRNDGVPPPVADGDTVEDYDRRSR